MKDTAILQTDLLIDVLIDADFEDVSTLVDYLTDSGAGRVSLSTTVKTRLMTAQSEKKFTHTDLLIIEREVRSFGGNSVVNLVRDAGQFLKLLRSPESLLEQAGPNEHLIAYIEVVRDVAERLDVKPAKDASVVAIEGAIIAAMLERSFERMSPEELKAAAEDFGAPDASFLTKDKFQSAIAAGKVTGVLNYIGAAIVANSVSTAVLGRAVFAAFMPQAVPRSVGMFFGPIGWALTSIWSIAELASPAYRVTVPCIVHVAYIRQKRLAKFALSAPMA